MSTIKPKTEKAAEEQAAPEKKKAGRPAKSSLQAALEKSMAITAEKVDEELPGVRLPWQEGNFEGKDLTNERQYSFKTGLLQGANLRGANLSGKNLQGANFAGADITGANFTGADLRWSILRGAIGADEADFTDANLYEATV